MSRQQSGSMAGVAVLAVLGVLAGLGAFVYKTVVVDIKAATAGDASGASSLLPWSSPSPSTSPAPAPAPAAAAPAPAGVDAPEVDPRAKAAPTPGTPAAPAGRTAPAPRGLSAAEEKQAREEAARWTSLLSSLNLQRDALDMYQQEHKGIYPDFRSYPKGDQLTRKTYADGTFAEGDDANPDAGDAPAFGPYVRRAVPNPLNDSADVAVVDGTVTPGDVIDPPPGAAKAGYVFSIEGSRLWATDSTGRRVADVEATVARNKTAIKPVAKARTATRAPKAPRKEDVLKSTTYTLRSQIALYRLQHQDQLPDFGRFPNWEQLLNKTNAGGELSPRGQFGPYMQSVPVNPMNGFTNVELIDGEPPAGYKPEGEKVGWVMDSNSGNVWGTDATGAVIVQ